MRDLAIIIVNYNTKDLTLDCLQSIFSKEWKTDFEVVVVDNNSSDDSVVMIEKKFPQVHLIKSNENLGFSRGNNLALEKIPARNYLLLNSDTKVLGDSIDELMNFLNGGEFDIVTCKLVNSDGSFQPNGGSLPKLLPTIFWLLGVDDILTKLIKFESYHYQSREFFKNNKSIGWISGAVVLLKSEVIKKIGGFDKKIFMYGEDVEFCYRATKAGFRIGWTDSAQIMHIQGASSEKPHLKQWMGEFRGILYIYEKHYGMLWRALIKMMIYFAILLRVVVFSLKGRFDFAKTYAQIAINI